MPKISADISQELYDYYKEHCEEKERTMAQLIRYALKRFTSTDKLKRERK